MTEVIATENWIIKVLPLTVHFAHLSDASLVVNDAFSHTLSLYSMEAVQYVNIKVRSRRNGVQPFNIRLNSSDFKDLQDRIVRVIEILPNINFHVSIVDKFVHVFKEAVQENPRYETSEVIKFPFSLCKNPLLLSLSPFFKYFFSVIFYHQYMNFCKTTEVTLITI